MFFRARGLKDRTTEVESQRSSTSLLKSRISITRGETISFTTDNTSLYEPVMSTFRNGGFGNTSTTQTITQLRNKTKPSGLLASPSVLESVSSKSWAVIAVTKVVNLTTGASSRHKRPQPYRNGVNPIRTPMVKPVY